MNLDYIKTEFHPIMVTSNNCVMCYAIKQDRIGIAIILDEDASREIYGYKSLIVGCCSDCLKERKPEENPALLSAHALFLLENYPHEFIT